MSKILITGGAGFIGSNLALHFLKHGHQVSVIDSLSKQIHGADPLEKSPLYKQIANKVRFIHASVNSKEDLQKAIEGQDAIVHLAAETGTGQSMYEIERYFDVNVGGTALLLDILGNSKHAVKKLVIASSRSVYGEGKYLSERYGIVYPTHRKDDDMKRGDFEVKYQDDDNLLIQPTDEDSKIHPSSVYGLTKQFQEQMIMTIAPTLGIAPVAFRYQNVYGPGQSLSNPYTGILSIFSTLIRNGQSINIFEDGKESRDFVFIDDVVEATARGLENESANGEVFNVGTGMQIDVQTVANLLMKNLKLKVPVSVSGNYRIGDIRHNFADIKKMNRLLNFTPKIAFEQGIAKFVEWVLAQPIQTTSYDRSVSEMKEKGLLK